MLCFKFCLIVLSSLSCWLQNLEADIPTAGDVEKILKLHNDYRVQVKPASNAMFKLVWNEDGAKKAEKLTKRCVFNHDKSSDRKTAKYPDGGGQNLAQGKYPMDWKDVIDMWYNEVALFEFGKDKNNFADVGHYTQLVWGSTREIGCAFTDCKSQFIYACNYYPGGNSPPYYVPYQKSLTATQSCDGCIEGKKCVTGGPYAGKLLEDCGTMCENQYTNCPELAQQGYCNMYNQTCAKSCRKECQTN